MSTRSSEVVSIPVGLATELGYSLITNTHPRRLLSADTHMLLISQSWTSFGDKSFCAAGP